MPIIAQLCKLQSRTYSVALIFYFDAESGLSSRFYEPAEGKRLHQKNFCDPITVMQSDQAGILQPTPLQAFDIVPANCKAGMKCG
jgi:hypothetical protein